MQLYILCGNGYLLPLHVQMPFYRSDVHTHLRLGLVLWFVLSLGLYKIYPIRFSSIESTFDKNGILRLHALYVER